MHVVWQVLAQVLEAGPSAGKVCVQDGQTEQVKAQLFTNTKR